jgi:hypothetical protein
MRKLIVVQTHYERDIMQLGVDRGAIQFCAYRDRLDGQRFDLIFLRDPGDFLMVCSENERAETRRWFRESLETRLFPGGRLIWF